MTKLYICVKRNAKCEKLGCVHSDPHERIFLHEEVCTEWGRCFFEDKFIKVRCVQVKKGNKP